MFKIMTQTLFVLLLLFGSLLVGCRRQEEQAQAGEVLCAGRWSLGPHGHARASHRAGAIVARSINHSAARCLDGYRHSQSGARFARWPGQDSKQTVCRTPAATEYLVELSAMPQSAVGRK